MKEPFEVKYHCLVGPSNDGGLGDIRAHNTTNVSLKRSNLFIMVHGDATFDSLEDFVRCVGEDINDLRKACDVKVTLSLVRYHLKSKPHYQIPTLLPVEERFMEAIFGKDYFK